MTTNKDVSFCGEQIAIQARICDSIKVRLRRKEREIKDAKDELERQKHEIKRLGHEYNELLGVQGRERFVLNKLKDHKRSLMFLKRQHYIIDKQGNK